MPVAGSTARGFPYPGDETFADVAAHLKALADGVEAEFDEALVLGSTLTASALIADSGTQGEVHMRDAGAGAGVRRSRLFNNDGTTRLDHPNDANSAIANVGLVYDHATGVIDHPSGFTGRRLDSPYFRAYRSSAVSLADGADVVFNSETADPNGWYDTTTGRFQPTGAGVYRVSWRVGAGAVLTADKYLATSLIHVPSATSIASGSRPYQRGVGFIASQGTTLLAFDGSTDYVVVRVAHDNGGSLAIGAASAATYFEAERIGA